MKTLAPKSTGQDLLADDWNKVPSTELQNAVTDQGITLNPSDDHQLTKSTANTVSVASSFIDSGSANVYNLSPVAPRKAPTLYISGMVLRFLPLNSNTGVPAILNLNALGDKDIKDQNGHDPAANAIAKGHEVELRYNGVDFILMQAKKQLNYLPLARTIDGLKLSNGTDTDHDIDIAVGTFIDTTNFNAFRNVSIFTKQIDATFAVGTGNGGRAAGVALANNNWYHLHALANPITGAVDFIFDTSVTAANALADGVVSAAGFTLYQRISSVKTDGAQNIRQFNMTILPNKRRIITWKDPHSSLSQDGSLPNEDIAQDLTLQTPLDLELEAVFTAVIEEGSTPAVSFAAINLAFWSPLINEPANPYDNLMGASDSQATPQVASSITLRKITNTISQIKWKTTTGVNAQGQRSHLRVFTEGWEE